MFNIEIAKYCIMILAVILACQVTTVTMFMIKARNEKEITCLAKFMMVLATLSILYQLVFSIDLFVEKTLFV